MIQFILSQMKYEELQWWVITDQFSLEYQVVTLAVGGFLMGFVFAFPTFIFIRGFVFSASRVIGQWVSEKRLPNFLVFNLWFALYGGWIWLIGTPRSVRLIMFLIAVVPLVIYHVGRAYAIKRFTRWMFPTFPFYMNSR